jgi:hypothetical protein
MRIQGQSRMSAFHPIRKFAPPYIEQPGGDDSRRKYQVTGMDGFGDAHPVRSEDRERAEWVAELMCELLDSVELTQGA